MCSFCFRIMTAEVPLKPLVPVPHSGYKRHRHTDAALPNRLGPAQFPCTLTSCVDPGVGLPVPFGVVATDQHTAGHRTSTAYHALKRC